VEPDEGVGAEPGEGVGEIQLPPLTSIALQKSEPLKQQPEADDASSEHEHRHVGAQVQLLQTLFGYAAAATKSTAIQHCIERNLELNSISSRILPSSPEVPKDSIRIFQDAVSCLRWCCALPGGRGFSWVVRLRPGAGAGAAGLGPGPSQSDQRAKAKPPKPLLPPRFCLH
jgi:hypothetical protein